MTWGLDAQHEDSAFAFAPPKDALKIEINDVATQRKQDEATRRATRNIRSDEEG